MLTVGPEDAKDALRKALSMGADKAIHVEDDDLHGTDVIGTSLVLAKAVEKAGYDLVVSGMASTDGTMGVVPALLAERLGVPQVTLLSEVAVDGRRGDRSRGTVTRPRAAGGVAAGGGVGDRPVGRGRATRPSRASWRPRRSRWSPWTCPTWVSRPRQVGLAGAWTAVESAAAASGPHRRARSSRTRARAASSSPSSSRAEVHLKPSVPP